MHARENKAPSKTAELVAAARADHTRSAITPVFEDQYAYAMCGRLWRTILSSRILLLLVKDGLLRNLRPILPAIFTRARFGEDCLEAAMAEGVDQFVIVGAGYDTFAFRRPDLMERLTLYELDQKATQDSKLLRMRAAGMEVPKSVRYVQADLTVERLQGALAREGFDFSRPAVISWFGVTYYLDRDTVTNTLTSIANEMAPGTTVVFDYLADAAWVPEEAQPLLTRATAFVARRGEPWLSSFVPPDLPDILATLGYDDVENLEPHKVGERYFAQFPDLEYSPVIGLCRARTAP